MRHLCPLILVTAAFVVCTSCASQAAGSYQTKPMFEVHASVVPVPYIPTLSLPQLSASQLCGGRGRYRDAETHECRGPGDFGY